jgi:pseudouridine-5'-phosphate glycosidase
VSADLAELAKTSVAVVSAGVKSVLDIGLTLETLETLGVPVISYRTDEFPAFFSRSSGFPSPMRSDSPSEVARIMHTQWSLGIGGGLNIANPIPEDDEIPAAMIAGVIEQALADMEARGIGGQDATPFLLGRIVEITGGESLRANIALVENNAHLGSEIAVEYAAML